jgi:putative transposase
MKKPGHKALRIGRYSCPGQTYLVTFATKGRNPLFIDPAVAGDAVECMLESSAWESSTLLHWVLMPDHWHGLIVLGEHVPLSPCVARLKGGSARGLRLLYSDIEAVWASGFHDRALRTEEGMAAAADYIDANPVRAGLVREIADYPFVGSVWAKKKTGLMMTWGG